MSKVENANTNLATQDAVYTTKRFLRMLAQPYEPVCLNVYKLCGEAGMHHFSSHVWLA
jgi:hypothetical protein